MRVYRKKGKGLEDKGVWSKGGVGEKGWAGRAGGEGNTAPPEGKRRAAGGARFSGRVVSRPARRAPPGGGGAHRTAPVSTGAALTGWPSSWTGGKVVQPGGRPRAARPEATDGREGGHLSPQRLAPATRPAPPAPFRGWGSLGRRGWRHAAHPRTSADTSWSRAQCCQAQCAAWAGRGARRVGGGGTHTNNTHRLPLSLFPDVGVKRAPPPVPPPPPRPPTPADPGGGSCGDGHGGRDRFGGDTPLGEGKGEGEGTAVGSARKGVWREKACRARSLTILSLPAPRSQPTDKISSAQI